MRKFNTAGPVNCKKHYCLPPLNRFDFEEVLTLIEDEKYFVMHAPRQTGKTSSLLALMEYLNNSGKYKSLYVNVEGAQAARENVREGMRSITHRIASNARIYLKDTFLKDNWKKVFDESGEYDVLSELLSLWAENSDLPLVLLIDEIDALVGDTLISVLRQLREGHNRRPELFPKSIILCGVRDVRDYRIRSSMEKSIITGGSAFNVKAASLKLSDFDRDEMEVLYGQHRGDTGQEFEQEALNLCWELTRGQPWLVNALGYEVCFKQKENRDRSVTITKDMIEGAKERIILRRETHIDQLVDKLSEPRVQSVIEPILTGDEESRQISIDDLSYVSDLGLIRIDKKIEIANRIYREVIPRELTYGTQVTISHDSKWYAGKEGKLEMEGLLFAFQEFFRENSEHWVERFQYKEAGPQLLLQAFLQRIINAGGRIEREYGLGRKRTDLLLIWDYEKGRQKVVIETKIRYGSLEKVIETGLKQTVEYMDRCNTDEGHLVIFDRSERSWEDKIFSKKETYQEKKIIVWGM